MACAITAEGIAHDRVFFVGNVMIDTLFKHRQLACGLRLAGQWGLERGRYATLTLHRPSRGDVPRGKVPEKWDGKAADRIVEILVNLGSTCPDSENAHAVTVQ
jgi:hypothetical protein